MESHGHDIKGTELNQRFAAFARRPLPDEDVWALALADMVMPEGSPGAGAYLTQVSGADCFAAELASWGRMVAQGIAEGRYVGRGGQRRRGYVEGYSETWGGFAVADGLSLAIFGNAPDAKARCDALGVGRQGYVRIRDFVGGCLLTALVEYRCALEWALGYRRDRVLEGRWEGITGLKWADRYAHETMGWERKFVGFAPGCKRVGGTADSDERLTGWLGEDRERKDPETLYPAIRTSGCWDDGYARRMRQECPVKIIYAPPRK